MILTKYAGKLYKCMQKLFRKSLKFKVIGENVIISSGIFGDSYNISLKSNIYIGPEAYFWGIGGINIEDNVIIGPKVTIHSSNHRYENANSIPYDEVSIKKPVHICSNVWVGGHSIIVPGVKINEGAVVAMGAVVTKDVPYCAIVGGNPARIIKYRNVEQYEMLKNEGKFYMLMKKQNLIKNNFVTEEELAVL